MKTLIVFLALAVCASAQSLLPSGTVTTILTAEAADLGVVQVTWDGGYITDVIMDYATAAGVMAKLDAAAGMPGSDPDEADPVVAPDTVLKNKWMSGGIEFELSSYKLRTESIEAFAERHATTLAKMLEVFPKDDQGGTGMLVLFPFRRLVA